MSIDTPNLEALKSEDALRAVGAATGFNLLLMPESSELVEMGRMKFTMLVVSPARSCGAAP